jgi:hypothetical protein
MRKNISKTQRELLELMREGWVVHHCTGLHPHSFLSHPTERTHGSWTVRFETHDALLRAGMVEKFSSDWRGYALRIKP